MSAHLCYDLIQLVDQLGLSPLKIVAHSLGAKIALRFAGLYPDAIDRLVAMEGLAAVPTGYKRHAAMAIDARLRQWVDRQRALAATGKLQFATFAEALARMQSKNDYLSEKQAQHLTMHGLRRNEDGSFNWKFDDYVRPITPDDISIEDLYTLWGKINCPVLLMSGGKSWLPNPTETGDVLRFRDVRVISFSQAGHWMHHDSFAPFMAELTQFLAT